MMSSLRRDALDSIACLFEDYSEENCAATAGALTAWIATLDAAGPFEEFIAEPMADELFAFGDADLELWGEIVSALLERGCALGGPEGADLIGWAFWCTGELPLALVGVSAPGAPALPARPSARTAYSNHVPKFIDLLHHESPDYRTAAAHALCWTGCGSEVGVLQARYQAEDDDVAKASIALALAVRGQKSQAVVTASALGTLCELAGPVLGGAVLDGESGRAIALVAHSQRAVPPAWGWRTRARVQLPESALALALLNRARLTRSVDVIEALKGVALGADAIGLGELAASAFVHLGFGARGVDGQPLGLVLDEVDDISRSALECIAGAEVRAEDALRRVGLPAVPQGNVVHAFLAATEPDWQPLNATGATPAERWHFGRLWGAVMAQELATDTAADRLTAAFTPKQCAWLISRFGISRMPAYTTLGDSPELWSRDQQFALAVFQRIGGALDWDSILRTVAADSRAGLPGIAVVGYLLFGPAPKPENFPELVERARQQSRVLEPLRSLLEARGAG